MKSISYSSIMCSYISSILRFFLAQQITAMHKRHSDTNTDTGKFHYIKPIYKRNFPNYIFIFCWVHLNVSQNSNFWFHKNYFYRSFSSVYTLHILQINYKIIKQCEKNIKLILCLCMLNDLELLFRSCGKTMAMLSWKCSKYALQGYCFLSFFSGKSTSCIHGSYFY